jgi:hypothetical protein
LLDQAEQIAARYHVSLSDVCTPARGSDVVAARHAIWISQIDHLGSQSAVARLWGVDHATVMAATEGDGREIVRVLLDELAGYRFEWIADRAEPFLIVGDGERRTFGTYLSARLVWVALLEHAGLSTFRSRSVDEEIVAPPPHPPPSEHHAATDGGAT